jgi:hypothetical protein
MPGSFRLSGSHFEMRDAAGALVFSTADKLFRVTDVVQGSTQFSLVATSPTETDRTVTIGSCNANANILLGYANASGGTAGFSALPSTGWWCVSTSYLHSMFGGGDFSYMSKLMITYSFAISAGSVLLNERAVIGAFSTPQGQQASYVPPVITYELWCGTLA